MTSTARPFRFSIDRGGTFTDIYAEIPLAPGYRVLKLLSVDPSNYKDAPTEGIRRILEEVLGKPIPRSSKVPTSHIDWIRMGTTVATNALLERKGVPTLLLTTRGFKDLLQIGNQTRPKIFDLVISKPDLLYEQVMEVDERVRILSKYPSDEDHLTGIIERGVTGEWIEILEKPELESLERSLRQIIQTTKIRSVAVVFLHSFAYAAHEKLVGKLCTDVGFTHVSMSHAVAPAVKIVQRGNTAMVDAYLTPLIKRYLADFQSGFDDQFDSVAVSFMMSDGGLCPKEHFNGFRSILSGPAGGVVGYSKTTKWNTLYDLPPISDNLKESDNTSAPETTPVIGIDMGGTSTDVSRYHGEHELVFETQTAGVFIQAPQLDIETVAAGGGSRLFFRSGLFVVGPESSSAHPGPVCYRKNGYLAITDANLVLGRILPEFFPPIFGPKENEPIGKQLAMDAMEQIRSEINKYFALQRDSGHKGSSTPTGDLSLDEVAYGFIRVANEAMCRPIRNITEAKGYELSSHVLSVFGGAGPQHACAIARNLGIQKVFVQRHCSILSAYGIGLADTIFEDQGPENLIWKNEAIDQLNTRLDALTSKCLDKYHVTDQTYPNRIIQQFYNLRYDGTDTQMMIERIQGADPLERFKENYRREYGFLLPNRQIRVDDIRVRVTCTASQINNTKISPSNGTLPNPVSVSSVYFGNEIGRIDSKVYLLSQLGSGSVIDGPAIIIDNTTSIVIEPFCRASITETGDVQIQILAVPSVTSSDEKRVPGIKDPIRFDSIQLSIFAHRFMSIAEQMGRALERTAVSTNIKERRDFSCALFGPDGELVANAPHLPVHLGSMQEAVKWQLQYYDGSTPEMTWNEGEVIASNHPDAGGSHLPDITVITPVFVEDESKPVFFVASRGHHADIGGITPGSMPPFSTSLDDEGASFKSFKLVKNGNFQEEGITEILMEPGKKPRRSWQKPSSGTRNLADNLSDLQAQIAANNKGIRLMIELIRQSGLAVVQAYMRFIQQTAEASVRDMLRQISHQHKLREIDTLHATDFMDEGARLELKITLDRQLGNAHFDFTGTDPQVYGNINAPKSVVMSAIIYCLRCMVNSDIPLNSGCMAPIQVTIPHGSFLDPDTGSAVVGGNVLTSQRVTDVILMAFKVSANSQGCMNNFTFGDETMGYYETIGGGAGAGPTWNGQDAIQVHMTNTRITDAEILERRYPVLLRQFAIRDGSGGRGTYRGGNGIIREFEFMKDLTVGILSERRSFGPKGCEGGGHGKTGRNTLYKFAGLELDGTTKYNSYYLGGKCQLHVSKRDRVRIQTPGGGGYGPGHK